MVTFAVVAPHSREDARMLLAVHELLCMGGHDIAVLALLVLSAYILGVSLLGAHRVAGRVELAGEERRVAVLLTAQVGTHRNGILRGVLVERRVGIGPDNEHEEGRVADDQHGETQHCCIPHRLLLLLCVPQSPHHQHRQQGEEEDGSAVERKAQRVDEEDVNRRVYVHNTRYDTPQYHTQCDHRKHTRDEESLPGRLGPLLKVHYIEYGRHSEQVEQVDTYCHTYQQRYEYQPPQGVRVLALLLPFQYRPEHQRGEETAHGIHLALYGREPEGVTERVGQRTYHTGCKHSPCAPVFERRVLGVGQQVLSEQRNAPEEEEDGKSAAYSRHHVDRMGCCLGTRKHREETSKQLERRCSRGMPHLQFEGRGDIFTTVPPRRRSLRRHDVHSTGYGTNDPTYNVVC